MRGGEMPKAYEHQSVESRWYDYWLSEGLFDTAVNPARDSYCIVIPPPNVTGVLHMGHALDCSIQDLLTRWKRMSGFEALWLPGSDHAGIATQNVVEQILASEGLSRHDLGRDKFVERVWEVANRHHDVIISQLRRVGASCDWRRERFTLDTQCSRAVREAFVTLFEQGLIYRGARMINWCPRCHTGLSDLEVEHREHHGHLWYIRYPAAGGGEGVVVATTRPETMLGDTAVAVSPADDRYRALIGNAVILPLMDRPIPVVADDAVDPAFGTGAVKVTPAHDPADLEIGVRHNLPSVRVISENGRMTEEAGAYAGEDRYEARSRIVEDLKKLGLLVQTDSYDHAVGHCQRCDTVVEPLVSTQWFVRMEPLAAEGLAAVDRGLVVFTPDRWTKIYRDWLEGIRDWCISRQLWWGHRIPVWYCNDCGAVVCTREDPSSCPCGSTALEQDPDVLDTWFSSALWPFSTLGWPDATPEMDYFHPTSVLVTAYDIIFFWVARMIMMGMHLVGRQPFNDVFIHGLVRDDKGQKMSKSRGNVVDPVLLMDEYGADALRFALLQLITHGQDIRYSEDRLRGARNFCNKLWNVTRFVLMNMPDDVLPEDLPPPSELSLANRWIMSRHAAMLDRLQTELEGYNIAQGADALYDYIWSEFCDWYVELAKPALYAEVPTPASAATKALLQRLLGEILRALHPFMPYITEELWQRVYPDRGSIVRQPWPVADPAWRDEAAEDQMTLLQDVIVALRSLRADMTIPFSQKLPVTLVAADTSLLETQRDGIAFLAACSDLSLQGPDAPKPSGALTAEVSGVEVHLQLAGAVDVPAQTDRLSKRLAKLEEQVAGSRRKLGNQDFLSRAPEEEIERERQRLQEAQATSGRLTRYLDVLRTLS
jgi:valyl-tRNA synthetase